MALRDFKWMDQAACAGMDTNWFFDDTVGNPIDATKARLREHFTPAQVNNIKAARTCQGCPVRQECGDFAEANKIGHGLWGGQRRTVHDAREKTP